MGGMYKKQKRLGPGAKRRKADTTWNSKPNAWDHGSSSPNAWARVSFSANAWGTSGLVQPGHARVFAHAFEFEFAFGPSVLLRIGTGSSNFLEFAAFKNLYENHA